MKKSVKLFAAMLALLLGSGEMAGQTTTFGFESQTELSSFSITCENANGSATIDSSKKQSGNSSLNLTMGGTSKKGIYVTTVATYQNVSSISLYLASSDKGKTSFRIEACANADFSSGVTTILPLSVYNTLFGSSNISNNTFYQATFNLSTPATGYLRFYFYQPSSSGKKMWLDDLVITTGGSGGDTIPTPPTPPASNDATLSDLKVDGTTIAGFSPSITNYSYVVPATQTALPVLTATATNSGALIGYNQATSMTSQANVLVTAADGVTQQRYYVQFSQASSGGGDTVPTPPTPPSTALTLHETEIYEASSSMAGYGGTLTTYGGREYEVYYVNRDASSNTAISINNTEKAGIITTSVSNTECTAADGWFRHKVDSNSGATDAIGSEFTSAIRSVKMTSADSLVLHVKGYSEFAIAAKDKKNGTKESDKRYFEVYIDGQLQAQQINTSLSIRRYPITTGEHVIRVQHRGTEQSVLYAFSLQVAYIPKLKHLFGNDSTQVVSQTAAIKPITYFLKNRISDAELTWNGAEATGITLVKGSDDTLTVQGTANCPVGTYSYTISAKDASGAVISSLNGAFSVNTKVECRGSLNASVFEQTAMAPVVFRCYALNMSDVTYQWTGTAAPGLSFAADATNHTVTLSGTPTTAGTYNYTVSVAGGNSLNGSVTVKSNSPTIINPSYKTLLFLYKNNDDAGLIKYIIGSGKYNYFARPAADALGKTSDYNLYDAIIISEDVDATNAEVLAIIRTLQKPVLNMKVFTYSANRLGWGDPDNGSISNLKTTILQPNHTIFSGLSSKSEVALISEVDGKKGLMPAEVNYAGTICLATAPKRGNDYESDGIHQTLIHEVPQALRGAKYLSLPIGTASAEKLTADGKKLIDNMIAYLTSTATSSVDAPTVQITAFSINGVSGRINQTERTIDVTMPHGTNVTALAPTVSLADNKLTYVTPASGETVDFSDTHYGVTYTVSDYITKVKYTVRVFTPTDLDNVENDGLSYSYGVLHNPQGVWVNIFSVSGQLITTTNSDFSFEGMARGMYLVRSQNGLVKVMH